jgi:hypothetical protein
MTGNALPAKGDRITVTEHRGRGRMETTGTVVEVGNYGEVFLHVVFDDGEVWEPVFWLAPRTRPHGDPEVTWRLADANDR